MTSTKAKEGSAARQRTCIVCGAHGDKQTLLRIVRSPAGFVEFDTTGRAAGRGAYVCSAECFEKARSTKRLERALKISLQEDDYDRVAKAMEKALQQGQRKDEE